jgi:hypothetical protein
MFRKTYLLVFFLISLLSSCNSDPVPGTVTAQPMHTATVGIEGSSEWVPPFPVPPNANLVAGEPTGLSYLSKTATYTTTMSATAVLDFYESELSEEGWNPIQFDATESYQSFILFEPTQIAPDTVTLAVTILRNEGAQTTFQLVWHLAGGE